MYMYKYVHVVLVHVVRHDYKGPKLVDMNLACPIISTHVLHVYTHTSQ